MKTPALPPRNVSPHHRQKPLKIGGVMRCSIETLGTTLVREIEGEVLPCKYCSGSQIFRGSCCEWNREQQ